jgi:hypothetical protein
MRNQGNINSFLCGCVDVDRSNGLKFMSIAYINGQSASDANVEKLLTNTGFFTDKDTNDDSRDFGKWFKLDSGKLPNFLSQRTFQHSDEAVLTGWKCKKHHYPDLWIDPKDSFVLTINAGEIVTTLDFSAGLSLRFPRIKSIRANEFGEGPKAAEEVETIDDLRNIYFERLCQQQDAERETQSQSQYSADYDEGVAKNKFKSMEQCLRKGSTRKKRPRAELNVRAAKIDSNQTIESNLLGKYSFMVLDGTYKIERNLDKKQARSEGWYKSVSAIKCQQDLINFILKHGGKIGKNDTDFIIGGNHDDPRVANYRRAIERATKETLNGTSKKDQNLFKMASLGVVKWTFLFATMHRLSKNSNDEVPSKSCISLIPRRHDFLIISKRYTENVLEEVENIHGIHLHKPTSMFEFKRALNEVKNQYSGDFNALSQSQSKRRKCTDRNEKPMSWQYQLDASLTADEKVRISYFLTYMILLCLDHRQKLLLFLLTLHHFLFHS